MEITQKNNAIESFRFFSMLQISLWHFNKCGGFWSAGYLGVEFFFILSGVFIYRGIYLKPNKCNAIQFTAKKLNKFYVEYVVALILAYIIKYKSLIEEISNDGIIETIFNFIGQLLILQDTGFFKGSYNNPTWFFSVLIWGGMIIFVLLKGWPKISLKIIFPLIFLLYLTYCFNYNTKNIEQFNIIGCFSLPFWRGIVDMAFGTILGYLIYSKDLYLEKYKHEINFLSLISIMLYIVLIFKGEHLTQYSYILFPIIIYSLFYKKSLIYNVFKNDIWQKLGAISFSMFLIHFPLRTFLLDLGEYFYISKEILIVVYLILLIPVSYLFNRFCTLIKNQINKYYSNKNKIDNIFILD